MRAFVLAGGEGTRLRPYTYSVPKPMLMLGGKPILQYVIENLKRCGIKDIILTVGYKHEQITGYFGDGRKFGVDIEYSIEKERMNTAGSITPFKGKVNETFAVVMGDHLTNIDLSDMLRHHKKSGALATIALYPDRVTLEYGVADIGKDGKVSGFREKPLVQHLYNTAIYMLEPEIFGYIKGKEDFAKDVFPRLLSSGKKIEGYVFEGVWFDIGRVSDYERFVEQFSLLRLLKDLGD
ncbi:MAG: nucleotidyltransferase family protein [Candidatus Micrarchaeota archaeon]